MTIVANETVELNIDFAVLTPPPNAYELIFAADKEVVGTKYSYLSNFNGNTPSGINLNSYRILPMYGGTERMEEKFSTLVQAHRMKYICTTIANRVARRVTFNGYDEMGAHMSPDGTRIVYSGDADGDGNYEIIIVNRDGTGSSTLVDDYDGATGAEYDNRYPAWSPDGVTIAYSTRRTEIGAPAQFQDYELQQFRLEEERHWRSRRIS